MAYLIGSWRLKAVIALGLSSFSGLAYGAEAKTILPSTALCQLRAAGKIQTFNRSVAVIGFRDPFAGLSGSHPELKFALELWEGGEVDGVRDIYLLPLSEAEVFNGQLRDAQLPVAGIVHLVLNRTEYDLYVDVTDHYGDAEIVAYRETHQGDGSTAIFSLRAASSSLYEGGSWRD